MNVVCSDNRFELIEKYKAKLIESTNIETSLDEMNVLNSILFRFWQMGWLDKLEQPTDDVVEVVYCKDCERRDEPSCQIRVSQYGIGDWDYCSCGVRREGC